jgi:hypothetical protein
MDALSIFDRQWCEQGFHWTVLEDLKERKPT